MPVGFCACQNPPTFSLSSLSFPLFIFHCTLCFYPCDFRSANTTKFFFPFFFLRRLQAYLLPPVHCPHTTSQYLVSETLSIEDALRRQQYWKWERAGEKWGLCHTKWSPAIVDRYKVANVDPSLVSFNQHNILYRNSRNRWCSHGCRHGCDCGNWGSAQSASARLSSLPLCHWIRSNEDVNWSHECDYAKHTS